MMKKIWPDKKCKSTVLLFFLALPALLIIINSALLGGALVNVQFVSGKQRYQKNFKSFSILPMPIRYCVSIYVKKSDFTAKFKNNKTELYELFDFNWWILREGLLVSGDKERPKSFVTAWASREIYFEFACFEVNPFRNYSIDLELKGLPKYKNGKDVESGFKTSLDGDQAKTLSLFGLLAYIWLLILSPFIFIKIYRFIKRFL